MVIRVLPHRVHFCPGLLFFPPNKNARFDDRDTSAIVNPRGFSKEKKNTRTCIVPLGNTRSRNACPRFLLDSSPCLS